MLNRIKGAVNSAMQYMKQKAMAAAVAVTGVVTGLAVTAQTAHAQASSFLPAGVDEGFTQMKADATTLQGYVWPVVIFITFALVAIGLFKKFGRKAT